MQHSPSRRLSRRPVLPVLLMTAAAGAFAGLSAVPTPGASGRTVTAAAAVVAPSATRPPVAPTDRDRDRASRFRPRSALTPAPRPATTRGPAAKPAAKPVAEQAAEPVRTKPVRKRTARPSATPRPVAERASSSRRRAVAPARRSTPTRAKASAGSGGRCPVPSASFTDTYGAARSGGRSHQGTDLLASYGAPVHAVADGVVDTTSSSNGGISLYLRAAGGVRYFYAHNSANVARDGQRVRAGQVIARVGSTGNAGSIDHVHFERQVGGASVNPYRFLRGIC